MSSPRIQIGMTNLNLAPKDLLRYNWKDYVAALDRGKFDRSAGYEWSDVRGTRSAARSLARLRYISVLHESWREDRWRDVCARAAGRLGGHVVESAGVAALFPLLDKSDRRLGELDDVAGGTLPIIVHPHGQALDNHWQRRSRRLPDQWPAEDVWFQPTAEWAAVQGIDPTSKDIPTMARDIVHQAIEQGMGGIALDLHHLTSERMGHQFSDPTALAIQLARGNWVKEIQPSIRPDFGGDKNALSNALKGNLAQTRIGEMLLGISEALPQTPVTPMRIVPEIRPSAIAAAGYRDYLAATAVVNDSIRQIFSAAS